LLGISWSPGYLRSSSFLTWSRKESTLLFAIIDIWIISVNLSTYPSPWLQHNFHQQVRSLGRWVVDCLSGRFVWFSYMETRNSQTENEIPWWVWKYPISVH
jgi:hypothetical protein